MRTRLIVAQHRSRLDKDSQDASEEFAQHRSKLDKDSQDVSEELSLSDLDSHGNDNVNSTHIRTSAGMFNRRVLVKAFVDLTCLSSITDTK